MAIQQLISNKLIIKLIINNHHRQSTIVIETMSTKSLSQSSPVNDDDLETSQSSNITSNITSNSSNKDNPHDIPHDIPHLKDDTQFTVGEEIGEMTIGSTMKQYEALNETLLREIKDKDMEIQRLKERVKHLEGEVSAVGG